MQLHDIYVDPLKDQYQTGYFLHVELQLYHNVQQNKI